MRIVKSSLRSTSNINYERVLETSTNIYYYPMGDHKGKILYAKKFDRKMNLLSEGIEVDNELYDIFISKNFSWINKKFDERFGIFK